MILKIEPQGIWPDDEEPLLQQDHTSPVGFMVPNLPAFPIDPKLARRGLSWLDLRVEFMLGIIMALAIGGGVCYLGFSTIDEDIEAKLSQAMFN